MVVQGKNYETKQEALEKFPEDLVKSFYLRPDGDRGWDEYKEYEIEFMEKLKSLVEEYGVTGFVTIYSNTQDGFELMLVIELDCSFVDLEEEDFKFIDQVFENECYPEIRIVGQGKMKIVYHERY